MMKKLLPIAACILLWSACSDDDAGPVRSTTPYQRITLTEVITPTDAQTVNWSQEFRFVNGQIAGCSTTQRFGSDEEMCSITLQESASITDAQAVVIDDEGTTTTYLLDDYGMATEAIRHEAGGDSRTYRFGYTTHGRHRCLASIEEYLADTLFAQLTFTEEASTNERLHLTQQIGSYHQTFLLTLQIPQQAAEEASPVPPLYVSELYPLTLHTTALYGKWLGEAWPWVTAAASTEGTSGLRTYSYTFTATGQLATCTQSTPEHRTIHYQFE